MAQRSRVPESRIRALGDGPIRPDGRFVLYWMIAARRTRWSFALDRAVELARAADKPLVVLEALRVGYGWASDRHHRFVIDGMRANERALEGADVLYHPYVEPVAGAGTGLLKALASDACAVVTDEYPCFFLPRMLARACRDVDVRFEAIDSNGLLPLRAATRRFARAHDFRRFLQRELAPHLGRVPRENALARVELRRLRALPKEIAARWPRVSPALLAGEPAALASLPIDHSVAAVELEGGAAAGARVLRNFVDRKLGRYTLERNAPESDGSSGLSPYLHFGHVGAHQVLARLAAREGWSPERIGAKAHGKREGWWGMSAAAEAFLDQLVTWRELGFNQFAHDERSDRFESLPRWAIDTLEKHASDPRPERYTRDELEWADTDDELWNAAQNQLRAEGRIHNYLRMLWGKKILQWSASPRAALATMVELNNKYALDGRDPNSYTGILWTLGKHDRPWGPERPIFGTVRYMASESTRRKLHVGEYIRRWNGGEALADRRKSGGGAREM